MNVTNIQLKNVMAQHLRDYHGGCMTFEDWWEQLPNITLDTVQDWTKLAYNAGYKAGMNRAIEICDTEIYPESCISRRLRREIEK